MEDIQVELARSEDAFAVAALHLQADRAAGLAPVPGFLDQFTDWWLPRRAEHPAWLASTPTGDPVGVLAGTMVAARPRLGRAAGTSLAVDLFYVPPAWRHRGIGSRLVVRAQSWVRTQGVTSLVVPASREAKGLLSTLGCSPQGDAPAVWHPGASVDRRLQSVR